MPDAKAFITANTVLQVPPHVTELHLHLASEIVPIWQKTEEQLQQEGIDPPFWAFAWAGGQAVARYVLDHPAEVKGRRVLDFGCGCGLIAIAAMRAGAAQALAMDIDPMALTASAMNAAANGVTIETTSRPVIGLDEGWDAVLVGDMCYERDLAARVMAWLRQLSSRGCHVLLGDPGRTYLPREGLAALATYEVPTTRELEDLEVRRTRVFRVLP
ncbi:MAG: methyltransferase [Alphaproteobacteria bacterium]|nr:methyltransferase [Alphaproteobacteria bacterium]